MPSARPRLGVNAAIAVTAGIFAWFARPLRIAAIGEKAAGTTGPVPAAASPAERGRLFAHRLKIRIISI
jgi:hypothetical protein